MWTKLNTTRSNNGGSPLVKVSRDDFLGRRCLPGTYGLELGLEDPFDDTEVMDSSDADEKHDDDAVDSVSESESISASASETLRSRRVGIRMGRRARTHGLGFAKGRWRAMEGIFVGT